MTFLRYLVRRLWTTLLFLLGWQIRQRPGWLLLLWVMWPYCFGVWLFTTGFFLTRTAVLRNNTCRFNTWDGNCSFQQNIINITSSHLGASETEVCRISPRFSRAVVIIIDGLRYDFAFYDDLIPSSEMEPHYKNKIPVFNEILKGTPHNARLYRFKADAPTTTLQRIKGLTTGTLPTFIDVGSNFGSSEILEDNFIWQLRANGRKVVAMGDDTWHDLFPGQFHRAYPYPSFNVKDLHTVDNGVIQNLGTELPRDDWDVIIAHFLGVDHCGHRYGPNHPAMASKLSQMDHVIRSVIQSLDDDTILFVLGDHGMTRTGDHGGDSHDEVTSALFVYSAKPLIKPTLQEEMGTLFKSDNMSYIASLFGTTLRPLKQRNVEPYSIDQVDIVPTISLLLGVPIPYSNLGTVILPLFIATDYKNISSSFLSLPAFSHPVMHALGMSVMALRINVAQVQRFLKSYSQESSSIPIFELASALDSKLSQMDKELLSFFEKFQGSLAKNLKNQIYQYLAGKELKDYLDAEVELFYMHFHAKIILTLTEQYRQALFDIKHTCEKLWATFNIPFIYLGLFLVTLTTMMLVFICASDFQGMILQLPSALGFFGGAFGLLILHTLRASLLGAWWLDGLYIGSFLMGFVCCATLVRHVVRLCIVRWQWYSTSVILFCIPLCCFVAFFSNSYVIYEDSMVMFLMQSIVMALVLCPFSRPPTETNKSFQSHTSTNIWLLATGMFVLLSIRLGNMFHKCREEQFPCNSSSLLLPLSSLPSHLQNWKVLRLLLSSCSLVLPCAMLTYWLSRSGCLQSYRPTIICIKYAIPAICICICLHWSMGLTTEDVLHKLLPTRQELFAQTALVICCLAVVVAVSSPLLTNSPVVQANLQQSKSYGSLRITFSASIAFLLLIALLLAALLIEDGVSPSFLLFWLTGSGYLMLLGFYASESTESASLVAWHRSVFWGLLATHTFFATGHQMTFSSLHWNAAFVVTTGEFTNNIIPGVFVFFNTFASSIICGLSLPLLLTWPLAHYSIFPSLAKSTTLHKGELLLFESPVSFRQKLLKLLLLYLLFHGIKLLGAMWACAIHRRHLMVWKIFAPRYIFEVLNMCVAFVAGTLSYVYINWIHKVLKAHLKEVAEHIWAS